MPHFSRLPTSKESDLARRLSCELSSCIATEMDVQQLSITDPSGEPHSIDVPVLALEFMVNMLAEIGDGNAVQTVPVHAELTTREAAEILNMSQQTVIELLNVNALASTRSGNQLKVSYVDVQAYKEKLKKDRLAALDELADYDRKLKLGPK